MGAKKKACTPLEDIRFEVERMVPMLGIEGRPPDILGTGDAAADRVADLLADAYADHGEEEARAIVDRYGLADFGITLEEGL